MARCPALVADEPRVAIDLVTLEYENGEVEYYQLPLAFYTESQGHLDHALVGVWQDEDFGTSHVYDAPHDRAAMAYWLRSFDAQPEGPLEFRRLPGHDLDLETHSTLFSGEQSNSSVAYGEDSLMKVFRKITPGTNPDIAVHEVLTRAGSDHVAALYGWLEAKAPDDVASDDDHLHLAMLQQFLRTASDGWDLALVSVRNLFTEADLHADEVGGDFAGESARLGTALAETHVTLAENFPLAVLTPDAVTELVDGMHQRLEDALAIVPASRSTPAGCGRRSTTCAGSVSCRSSRSTVTSTSGRPCAPCAAGRSWTSRASRPSRSPSGSGPTPAGATWPGCSARSTTPRASSSAPRPSTTRR